MKIHGIYQYPTLPEKNYVFSWKFKNPEANIRIWSFEEAKQCLPFYLIPIFNSCKWLIQQVNMLRVAILQQEGGLYLDLDMEAKQSFATLQNSELIFGGINDHNICNAVLGGFAHHPFWEVLLRRIEKEPIAQKETDAIFTPILNQEIKNLNLQKFIKPFPIFFPRLNQTTSETLTIHHAGFPSWIGKEAYGTK